MLNEKIQQAQQETRQKNTQQILIFGVIGLVCIVVLAVLTLVDFTSASEPHVQKEPEVRVFSLSQQELDGLRADFKTALNAYESEVEPQLTLNRVENWSAEHAYEIKTQKAQSIASFASGEYRKALDELSLVKTRALDALAEQQAAYEKAYDEAFEQFRADNYDHALLHINKALQINPTQQDAQTLKTQIEKLPELLPVLEHARIAKSENNPAKEFAMLKQALEIDPSRTELVERVAELEITLKDMLFETSIEVALDKIDQRKAVEAREHFSRAKSIYPDRSELKLVNARLLALESRIRKISALRAADKAMRQDDWVEAKKYYEKAANEDANDKDVMQGLERANEILRLKSSFASFQSNPLRLAVPSYRRKAEADLVVSETYGNYSFSLMNQANDLVDLIGKMNQKKKVFVISDNQTNILVRGVGKVGLTSGRSIKLKPGEYTFEGQRVGYKSKLVKVLVPIDEENTKVTVICDEPI